MTDFIETVKLLNAFLGKELTDGGKIGSIVITITDKHTGKVEKVKFSRPDDKENGVNKSLERKNSSTKTTS